MHYLTIFLCVGAASSMLLMIAERVAADRLGIWASRLGPVVLRQTIDLTALARLASAERGVGPMLVYERLRDDGYGKGVGRLRADPFLLRTPFLLGALGPFAGHLEVICRAPLGVTLSFGFAVAAWLSGLVWLGVAEGQWLLLATGLAALLLITLAVFESIKVERTRLSRQIDELQATAPSGGS